MTQHAYFQPNFSNSTPQPSKKIKACTTQIKTRSITPNNPGILKLLPNDVTALLLGKLRHLAQR
ncbi:hypothetical protein H5410_050916 [Solanum commersonii]|uniref:Uncharacterized protein n=1 Tax=Solanum commersonii TaxID=4109 RepID=A0A9J5WWS1_SOLCO|nr:hypothetical protein H5410_050916 [Solanum commersonii]